MYKRQGLDRADARAGLSEDVAELATELVGKGDKVKDGVGPA